MLDCLNSTQRHKHNIDFCYSQGLVRYFLELCINFSFSVNKKGGSFVPPFLFDVVSGYGAINFIVCTPFPSLALIR